MRAQVRVSFEQQSRRVGRNQVNVAAVAGRLTLPTTPHARSDPVRLLTRQPGASMQAVQDGALGWSVGFNQTLNTATIKTLKFMLLRCNLPSEAAQPAHS